MKVVLLLLNPRSEAREWPRFREGAIADERSWIKSLDDREFAEFASGLGRVDRFVRDFRQTNDEPKGDAR